VPGGVTGELCIETIATRRKPDILPLYLASQLQPFPQQFQALIAERYSALVPQLRPINPGRMVRAMQSWSDFTVGIPGMRRFLLSPIIARPGYWFATLLALLWGSVMSLGRIRAEGGLIVARKCPGWSFGRGGTTIGAVYITFDRITPPVLEHEAVHRAQWKRYGLCFIPLYIAAGVPAITNRFEVAAGLEKAGYV
jgi:hypothetical protein